MLAQMLYLKQSYTVLVHLVTSIGGSSYLDMPIEITLGGTKTLGTADKFKATDTPVFTPAT